MHRALTTNLSLPAFSKLSVYRVSCLRISLPLPCRDLDDDDDDVDFSHSNHPRAATFFLFHLRSFLLRSSPRSTLPGYSVGRTRGTRNYETVHDRMNRMPRRIGPLRILISIVIKFFVAPRALQARFAIKTTMMTDAISVALPTGFLAPHTKSYAFRNACARVRRLHAVSSFLHLAHFCRDSIIYT